MTKTIIFRADGNATTGLGHLYRLFSLVEIVKDTYKFVFITQESSTIDVIPEDYTKIVIPKSIKTEDEIDWLVLNFSAEDYIIIADGYQFTSAYQKQLKTKGFKLIYIDDLANEHMYADVVINHSPYLEEQSYKKEAYTKLALGTKYALLRPLFLQEAKQNRTIITIDTAFVCFGGADPYNLSFKAVKALLQMPKFKNIHVILGGAYQHLDIFNLENRCSSKIVTYKNLSEKELIKVMRKCNFAIAPASTILFEICCVKMAILSGFYVDNQALIYKGFLDNKVIYNGGNMKTYEEYDFISKIEAILNTQNFNYQIEEQKKLFDDKIALRQLNLISELC